MGARFSSSACAPPPADRELGGRLRHSRLLLLLLAVDVVLLPLHLFEVEVYAHHALVDIFDVVARRLEVGGGVVGAGNKDLEKTEMEGSVL